MNGRDHPGAGGSAHAWAPARGRTRRWPALCAAALVGAGCTQLLGIEDVGPRDPAFDAAPGDADAPIAALALGSDYDGPGRAGLIDVRSATVQLDAYPGDPPTDPVVRRFGDEIFVVHRFGGDRITVLSAASLDVLATYDLPAGSNPQDVAVSPTQLYVPALASNGMFVVRRDSGMLFEVRLLDTVDPDGRPDCMSAFYTGNRVYIACGILDEVFRPRGPGQIAVWDPFNNTVVSTLALPWANPTGALQPTRPDDILAGDLVIGTVPSYTDLSVGCLTRISLDPPEQVDCLTTNQMLGGAAHRVEATPDGGRLWIAAALYDASLQPLARVVALDPAGGIPSAPITDPGQDIVDVAACPDGFVLASDRRAGGVRIYRAGTASPVLVLGEPPVQGGGLTCF
jgi:hypothetical protein